MTHRLRRVLEADLGARLDAGHPDAVLLALHIGCGANALGITGRIDPASTATEVVAKARTALAAGDRVEALRVCADAMAGELPEDEVETMVEVLDEIRRAR